MATFSHTTHLSAKVTRALVGCMLALIGVSCGLAPNQAPAETGTSAAARLVPIRLGPGYPDAIAWSRTDLLVIGFAAHPEATSGSSPQVWTVRPDGSAPHQVDFSNDPACEKTEYGGPTSLADGRVAFIKTCYLAPSAPKVASYAIVAQDLKNKQVQEILKAQDKVNPAVFSLDPQLNRGVVGIGGDFCTTIAWLTNSGPDPIPISVGTGTKMWRLDASLQPGHDKDCSGLGRADLPSWSPDGKQIAFFASPESIGRKGEERLSPPWEMYLMDPVTLKPRVATGQLVGPTYPAWSPDSHSIAFGATINDQQGTWILNVTTGRLRRFSSQAAQDIAWSPDGRRLVILHDKSSPSQYPPDIEIVAYDVSALVN